MSRNSFAARSSLDVGGRNYEIFRLDALGERVARLPYSLKVLLENLLRREDGGRRDREDVDALAGWDPAAEPMARSPSRRPAILMQDFTGVPAVVDLAAMRDAMAELGGDPPRINPLVPVDLVIDHSIVADVSGGPTPSACNAELEFAPQPRAVPLPALGPAGVRQLPGGAARTPASATRSTSSTWPRWCSATDGAGLSRHAGRHRLAHHDGQRPRRAWGGASAASRPRPRMLGQPVSMLIPRVVGFKLTGELPEGATATDLVLTVTSCCAPTAWWASSWSSTAPAWPRCRWRTGRPSAT